jgi:hypothetical protein
MARQAGLNRYWEYGQYNQFTQPAWEEHFAKHADADGIYWMPEHHGGDSWWYSRKDGECYFNYGRCKSGRRWFWRVSGHVVGHTKSEDNLLYGWADNEDQAKAEGCAAIKRLAGGRRTVVQIHHGMASLELKEINRAKWKERPAANGSDAKVGEYLYGHTMGGEDVTGHPVRFRITKKTKKRIFYLRQKEEIDIHGNPVIYPENIRSSDYFDDHIGFVDRQKLEATGEVHNHGRHWCYADFHLYASLQGLLGPMSRYTQASDDEPDLQQLKAAMAAAHPDKGGASAAFIAARQEYLAARRRASSRGEQ